MWKTLSSFGMALSVVLAAAGCGMEAEPADPVGELTANLSGAHYDLNLIGTGAKTAPLTGNDGHRIFVPLTGNTQILLSQGPFQVLDANGTDGSAAFQRPNPDPNNTGITGYSVWARALGKPGGSASQTTCATDVATGTLYCSIYSSVYTRTKGQQTFTNVSKQLLYVYAIINGVLTRFPLFDANLTNFYWQYDNTGLRLAQLRFYPGMATNVN